MDQEAKVEQQTAQEGFHPRRLLLGCLGVVVVLVICGGAINLLTRTGAAGEREAEIVIRSLLYGWKNEQKTSHLWIGDVEQIRLRNVTDYRQLTGHAWTRTKLDGTQDPNFIILCFFVTSPTWTGVQAEKKWYFKVARQPNDSADWKIVAITDVSPAE